MIVPAEPDALPEILSLLRDSNLPTAGVADHFDSFLLARTDARRLIGCVGLEAYGDVGLLRSLAVASSERGTGLGTKLVERLFEEARSKGIATLYLLTTTAEAYFRRFGFESLTRDEAAPALEASEELRGACPASALLMRLRL